MNNRSIRNVVILGAFAIALIIITQFLFLINSWSESQAKFNDKTIAALKLAADKLTEGRDIVKQPNNVTQLTWNTFGVNIGDTINAEVVNFYLDTKFEEVNLREDYEYAIYDCHDEKMINTKFVSRTMGKPSNDAVTGDFPRLEDATYYFVVRFPKRFSQVLASMGLTLLLSLGTFLTVLIFIYALAVILRQKRLSELQKDFINNMTHEFKTPISTIKVAADVFAANPHIQNDARMSKYAQIVREQNNRLNSQVEKVLQLTRIDRNTLELNKEVINLHELLHTILPTIQVKIEGQNGVLTQDLTAKQAYVEADTLHLTNIIHNLLDNAMKYCRDNKPEISVRTENFEKKVRLIIEDKGIGIDKEHLKKVFQRFYRVPTGNIHNVKGFGLGLYYVRNIVAAHLWQINLNSDLGEGTSVVIDIPKVVEAKQNATQIAVLPNFETT